MTDFMLDIETMGTRPGCAVLSIGAVTFDRATGEIDRWFYRVVDLPSCERAGLGIEAGTAAWWMAQEDAARREIFDRSEFDLRTLEVASEEFVDWTAEENEYLARTWWSQGAAFDFPILEEAMRVVGWAPPWRFWNCRDTRTAYDLCGFDAKAMPREGTYHNALDDCRHQVACLHAALKAGGMAP